MSAPGYRVAHGQFVVVGKEPDADSVRFVPDDLDDLDPIYRADRIDPSNVDGSVQLRFEGIDAPEVHYGVAAQRLGRGARDQLLSWMGFTTVQFSPTAPDRVTAATPDRVPGFVLTKGVDPNGRPISYVVLDADAGDPSSGSGEALQGGEWRWVDDEILGRSLNHRLLQAGHAYLTVYTSTPAAHRRALREVARVARRARRGVWALDRTDDWVLETQADIGPGPDGQLILPKLFRRCTDYLKDVTRGFTGNLEDWLVARSTGSRSENDLVLVCGNIEVPLSVLIQQRNRRVRFTPDPLDVVFVEK